MIAWTNNDIHMLFHVWLPLIGGIWFVVWVLKKIDDSNAKSAERRCLEKMQRESWEYKIQQEREKYWRDQRRLEAVYEQALKEIEEIKNRYHE